VKCRLVSKKLWTAVLTLVFVLLNAGAILKVKNYSSTQLKGFNENIATNSLFRYTTPLETAYTVPLLKL